MRIVRNYINVWKKSLDYSSRSTRKEFWVFHGITFALLISLSILGALLFASNLESISLALFITIICLSFTTIVPSLALCVRRLHDINFSGWFILLWLVPYIGGFIILVFALMPSKSGVNKYGPNPFGDGGDPSNIDSGVTSA